MPQFYQPYRSQLVGQMGTFNPPPEIQVDRDIIPRGLDQLFNQYMAMKQGQRQETELAGQEKLRAQQLAAGQGAAALQNVHQTAQFGAPLASYTPEQISRAGQGIQPQGPGLPPDQARLQRLVEGMGALRTQQGQTGRLAEANILGEEQGARLKGAEAGLYERNLAGSGPTGGPKIVSKGGREFQETTDSKGNVRYELLPPNVKADGKMLPPATVLALNEGQAVARLLPDVEAALRDAKDIIGPVRGRIGAGNPYWEKAQTLDARFRTASQAYGRFAEGGVLRKEDEEKYRKMFPQLTDGSVQIAKNKLSIVRRQLAQKYESDKAALDQSGYDISGFGTLNIPPSLFGEGSETGGGPVAGDISGIIKQLSGQGMNRQQIKAELQRRGL